MRSPNDQNRITGMANYSVGDTSQDPAPNPGSAMSADGDQIIVRRLSDVNDFCSRVALK